MPSELVLADQRVLLLRGFRPYLLVLYGSHAEQSEVLGGLQVAASAREFAMALLLALCVLTYGAPAEKKYPVAHKPPTNLPIIAQESSILIHFERSIYMSFQFIIHVFLVLYI